MSPSIATITTPFSTAAICIAISLLLVSLLSSPVASSDPPCSLFHERDTHKLVGSILCLVETKKWTFHPNSRITEGWGCILEQKSAKKGEGRCETQLKLPKSEDVPVSPPPPAAKIKEYHRLAMKAEALVPKTWFRDGYAHDSFLLSHNDAELPRKMIDISSLRTKKLRNINQCVTRQQFIRKSLYFGSKESDEEPSQCTLKNNEVVNKFYLLWTKLYPKLVSESDPYNYFQGPDGDNIKLTAIEVLDFMFANFGGIWTGCFKIEKDSSCRGALAAASMVVAMHTLSDIAAQTKDVSANEFVSGYMLASIGRGVLHGDIGTTGEVPLTIWNVKLADFVALQAAFLKLYIDTFGTQYTKQLNDFIPISMDPGFADIVANPLLSGVKTTSEFEPIYTSLRNWMFTEASNLIDFGPYRPLAAVTMVRDRILDKPGRRRVLVDVGANGFFASPKYLIDSYAPYLPFTHAYMIEPEPHFSATIPPIYSQRYNITSLPIYVEVGTGTETDIINLLPKIVTEDDYVVLKFDVDPNRFAQGATMEWGFLFDLVNHQSVIALVDELYIELHFYFPSLQWNHYHSNLEALDTLRRLRELGVVVHAWP